MGPKQEAASLRGAISPWGGGSKSITSCATRTIPATTREVRRTPPTGPADVGEREARLNAMVASGKLPEALDEFFADDAALQEDALAAAVVDLARG